MKKSLLALSVAAALGAGASVAHAAANPETGNALVVPYYSVQNGNNTLINIVNTDTIRGKAVKVRFRGAEHSDDVYDFQLFLSPGDVWTANVNQDGSGVARLTTNDNSCTLPDAATLNASPFVTSRLAGTEAQKVAGTREGYVEIINMGDIINTGTAAQNALYTATKHDNNGNVACTANVLQSVITGEVSQLNVTSANGAGAARLSDTATGGLFANVTLINVADATSWAYEASIAYDNTPVESRYWSQTNTAYAAGATGLEVVTADGIFLSGAAAYATTAHRPAQYDFPDLSTPRVTGQTAEQWYEYVSGVISNKASYYNEFITDSSIFAATDWVFSFPTRRYAIEGRPLTSVRAGVLATGAAVTTTRLEPFASIYDAATNSISVASFASYDRSERTATTGVVVSPGQVVELSLKGEVGVTSFNSATSQALGAELTVNPANVGYVDGWAQVTFAGAVPTIAKAFVYANNGGGATAHNFGGVWSHRTETSAY